MGVEVTDQELVDAYPGEGVDHDTRAFYTGWLQRRLVFNRCGDCGTWHDPPKPICPSCWSGEVVATAVSGRGTIYMAIFLHQGPPTPGVTYDPPYPVVTVELEEGIRFSSTVVGSDRDEIVIGAAVTLDWVDRAGAPVPVFRIARQDGLG